MHRSLTAYYLGTQETTICCKAAEEPSDCIQMGLSSKATDHKRRKPFTAFSVEDGLKLARIWGPLPSSEEPPSPKLSANRMDPEW